MRSWKWWALALLVPGGLLVAAILRARRSPTPGRNFEVTPAAAARSSSIDRIINAAKSSADSLRSGLKNDPLAASLIGVSPELIGIGSPAAVADRKAGSDAILAQISEIQDRIAAAQAGYARDHFGGQSPEQFSGYVNSLTSQIAALQAQLQSL